MPLATGTILGQYEIKAPLGAGGMGEVYRAHDSRLGRDVAIKVLPESVTRDSDRLQRFEQEARAAAALNHPNILAVYQMSTVDGGISYLVTELLEGETLRDRLRRGPVPLRKAIDYAEQIAHGLAAPHEKGIVHRDLKPENLFVTKDDRIKILDFGLAKVTSPIDPSNPDVTLTQDTDPGMVVGTVGYMAPEQVRGKPADHRSDIFAFGNVLYEMLTGRQTFRKPTSAETMTAILNEEPPPVSQVAPATPPGLQRVVNRCLDKNPEKRFQSAADLAFALESLSDSGMMSASGTHPSAARTTTGLRVAISVLVLVAVASAVTYVWTRPPALPKISNYVQLTNDGKQKFLLGTDGSRIYLADSQGLAEMFVSGGGRRRLPIALGPNMLPVRFSPDGSQVLAIEGSGVPAKGPLWVFPVFGGPPRRLGDAAGQDAAWSRDGNRIVYLNGVDVFVANADGSQPHKVSTVASRSGPILNPSWSTDGKRLRFDFGFGTGSSVWEVGVDGRDLHQVLPDPPDPNITSCCGLWSTSGKYFIFIQGGQLWALPRSGGLLHASAKPVQLTSSPMSIFYALPSKDGKKLFVLGATARGELVRYDSKTKQFVPYLNGISAEYTAFSADGQWVAYVSFPEGTLWRSKVDGTQQLQLTSPPNYAMMPRWSPDGKSLIYNALRPDGSARIYQISSDGGSPHELLPDDHGQQMDANWSPDGSKIIFAGLANDRTSTIRILDLATHQLTTLPGSEGIFSPRWSGDGRYIPAFSVDLSRLLVYDMQTQKWKELAKGILSWINMTKDGQHVVFLDEAGTGTIFRVSLADGKIERIADLNGLPLTGQFNGSVSIAPDDSPLVLRNAGTQDIYSVDWQEP